MPESTLIITFMPSLVSILWGRELDKGAPLTEQEVLDIRDKAATVALPPEAAANVEEKRGYRDIDGENCWEEWQKVRLDLIHDKRFE